MINALKDVKEVKCEWFVKWIDDDYMPCPVIMLCDGNTHIPIVAPSWHVDVDGYITSPSTGDYDDDWLGRAINNSFLPPANKLRRVILDWLEVADLSPLNDKNNEMGHKQLALGLLAAIKQAQ